MARPKSTTPPKYLKASKGQARCCVNRIEYPLGKYGSPESHERYNAILEYWRQGVQPPRISVRDVGSTGDGYSGPMTLSELAVQYLKHCQRHYRKNDKLTSEYTLITSALGVLLNRYGDLPVQDFDCPKLEDIRELMITTKDWLRPTINRNLQRVVAMFEWGVIKGFVKLEQYQMLDLVPGIGKGRDPRVSEPDPVTDVPDEHVEAIKDYCLPHIWAMIQLQRHTGMRPGEVVLIRRGDYTRDEKRDVWIYRPSDNKLAHHEDGGAIAGRIVFGPNAMEIISEWEKGKKHGEHLFSPKQETEKYYRERSKEFDPSKYFPSEIERRRVRNMNAARRQGASKGADPGDHYTTQTYRRAVERAINKCNKAGRAEAAKNGTVFAPVPNWTPNQIRHTVGTQVSEHAGIEKAGAVLRQKRTRTTELYAHHQLNVAADVMKQMG